MIFSIPKWFILEQMTVNGAWSKNKLKSNLKFAGSTDILSSDNLIYIYNIHISWIDPRVLLQENTTVYDRGFTA